MRLDADLKVPLFIMQGTGALIGLILFPLYLLQKQKRKLASFFEPDSWHMQPALLVIILVVVFMGFNSVFIDFNQKLELPDWFGFGTWARNAEDRLHELTTFFTVFDTTGQFLLAFVVMAVIPAVGEELVFRGFIQNDFLRATRNPHAAIWLTAILFSAVHLQFFGFIPRMFLGALFGYLYYWSGNLIMPMLGHLVNNGVMIIGIYLNQKGAIAVDLETPERLPWKIVIISGILSALLLYAYRTFYLKHARTETFN
jgi:membrane protease YdiL (CAAX protease family)